MHKHLYLILFAILYTQVVSGQKLIISPASLAFHTTVSGNTDSILATFSLQNLSTPDDSIIIIKHIDTYNNAFFCKQTDITVTSSKPATVWVYFKPVHNITIYSYLLFANTGSNAVVALPVKGTGTYTDPYYSTTQNLSEEALKTELKNIITTGHTALGYNGARDKMFMEIDNKKVNGQGASVNTLECVYTGRVVTGYTSRSDAQTSGNLNTEHTWPQSLFNSGDPMVSDLNHLFVTDNPANNTRSNYPFGMVSNPSWSVGGSKYAGGVFEPRDAHKGAVARAMMYFVLRYQDYSTFFAPQENILRSWHGQFTPNDAEQKRNIAVKNAQGNKNPFIDHPEFADRITLLAGNSIAPVRTTIGYNSLPITMHPSFSDVAMDNDGYVQIVNTGTSVLHYTATFAQNKFSLPVSAGVMSPDSAASVSYYLPPPAAGGDLYDTLIISSNATNAPQIKIPIKASVTLFSGIEEKTAAAFTFQLFPNPSNNELNISSKNAQEYDVCVTNLHGQQMISAKGNQALRISTAELPAGLYIVTLRQKQSVQQAKLMIQH